MFFHLLAHKYKPCNPFRNPIFLHKTVDWNWFRQISKQKNSQCTWYAKGINFSETKDTLILHPQEKRTILSKLYNTLSRLLSTKIWSKFLKVCFFPLYSEMAVKFNLWKNFQNLKKNARYDWKTVLGEPVPKSERCHSRKCLQESVDVYRGVSFGIQLTSRHAQQSGIPVTFRKTSRNRCLYQMTKFKGVICHETCQGFRCCVSLVSGTTALTTINKRLKKEKWTKQARKKNCVSLERYVITLRR